MWRKVIRAKYGQNGLWCSNIVNSSHGIGVWKSIRLHWNTLADNTSIKVGNGRKTLFWSDNWLGHGPLKELFPNFFSIATSPTSTLDNAWGQQGWNVTFRRALNDWELQKVVDFFNILEQFQGLGETEDKLCWNLCRSGNFTVKSAYTLVAASNQQLEQWPWRYIWKVKAPFKVVCFSWLVARKACLTQENLRRRGFQLCSRCLLCGSAIETNSHLFLHCPFTDKLWQLFLNIAGLKWSMPANTCELLKCWNYNGDIVKQKKWWRLVPACIW